MRLADLTIHSSATFPMDKLAAALAIIREGDDAKYRTNVPEWRGDLFAVKGMSGFRPLRALLDGIVAQRLENGASTLPLFSF